MATAALGTDQRPLRAALLLRVSDSRQAEAESYSLDSQRRVGEDLCRRKGWVVVREYVGAGESAFTRDVSKRETVRALLADATSSVFDVLIVHDLSRYARDEELGHFVLNNLHLLGVKLVNATNDIDYDTPEGRIMFSMELSFSAAGSRKSSFHIKKAKQQKFEMGLHVGDVPFGYSAGETNKHPLSAVPHEAAAIRQAFEDFANGAGYTEIARRWNGAGLQPHSKRHRSTFAASAIQSIIENDFYCGYIRHLGERKLGLHEAIISEDLWTRAQVSVRRQSSRAREAWLLSGTAACVECDGPIWQFKTGTEKTYSYYRETSAVRERDCSIAGAVWRRDLAKAEVCAVIESMTADPRWLDEIDRSARTAAAPKDDRRAKLMAKKKRLTNAYIADAKPEAEWREEVRALDEQLRRLPPDNPTAVVLAGERLASIGQVWVGMTTDERREAIRILFRSVKMNTREKKLWLDPWPEFAPLFEIRRDLCVHGTPGRTRTCAQGLGNLCSIL